ncbi:acetylxylan esterase [Tessaracoccus terricola]
MDNQGRSALVADFSRAVFGEGPAVPAEVSVLAHRTATGWKEMGTAHNLVLETSSDLGSHRALLTAIHPAGNPRVPMFVGMNFRGNHTISTDPAVELPGPEQEPIHYDAHTPDPQPRGSYGSRWAVELLLRRGFGLATACYLQLGPDSAELHGTGLFPLLQPDPSRWGGIGMWAWYLQRIREVLAAEGLGGHHILFGHSRLGKTALWAAAQDEAFDGVVSNNSGCMGASLSTTPGAETPQLMATVRPYWFNRNFADTVGAGAQPLHPQTRLMAAIAPRPVYVASAEDDHAADPLGEEAAVEQVRAAEPSAVLGYHRRPGGHDVTTEDWRHFVEFFASKSGANA